MRRHSRLKAEETSKTKKNQTSIATRIMLARAQAIEAGTVADAVAGPVAAAEEAEEDTVADVTDEAEEDGMVVAMVAMVAMVVRDVKVSILKFGSRDASRGFFIAVSKVLQTNAHCSMMNKIAQKFLAEVVCIIDGHFGAG